MMLLLSMVFKYQNSDPNLGFILTGV